VSAGDVRFLSVADVVALHNEVMERMGHRPAPLRDAGVLEPAVLMPQKAAYYQGADLVRQAVLIAIGISQAQAFVDGNRRTAYMAMAVFLRRNGRPFGGNRMDLAKRLEAVAARTGSLEAATRRLEDWLREYVEPTS
jgi:death-on-curing protein